MKPRRYYVGASLLTALSFAVGCNGGDASQKTGTLPVGTPASSQVSKPAAPGVQGYDCATLVSVREIDQVTGLTGAKLVSSVRGDDNDVLPGHTECGYALPEDFTVGVAVYSGRESGEAVETFDTVWSLAETQGAQALPGIGDRALLQNNLSAGPRILARADGCGIIVGVGDLQGLGKLNLIDVARRITITVTERL